MMFTALLAAIQVLSNVVVPMRDGAKLVADVYLPEGSGRNPVLLYRTPYDKRGQRGAGEWFAHRR